MVLLDKFTSNTRRQYRHVLRLYADMISKDQKLNQKENEKEQDYNVRTLEVRKDVTQNGG